ncbi:MAG TPA: hypothetical protein VJ111_07420 [Chitinophagaceae bacterium]|nr:hypothetical protein [Chitinophagaceae bacterium]
MILSVVAPSILIQDFSFGLKTSGNPFQQTDEWIQTFDLHTTVTSLFV